MFNIQNRHLLLSSFQTIYDTTISGNRTLAAQRTYVSNSASQFLWQDCGLFLRKTLFQLKIAAGYEF